MVFFYALLLWCAFSFSSDALAQIPSGGGGGSGTFSASNITGATADATPTGDDQIVTANDPGGTPALRKVTITDLAGSVPFAIFQLLSGKDTDGGYVGLETVTAPPAAGSCAGNELIIDTSNNRAYTCHGAGEDPIDIGEFADGYSQASGDSGSATAVGASPLSILGTTNEITTVCADGSPDSCTASIASTFRITGKTATAPVKTGTAAPGTCTVGDLFYDTDATAGSNLFGCTATNVFTLLGGSGSGVAPVIRPYSSIPVTAGLVYSKVYNSEEELMHVTDATTLTSDAIWRLRFQIPQALPSGTAKVRLLGRANATSGDVKVDPKWCSAAVEEASCTVVSETTQTITWGAGDTHQRKELKVTLDADTVVAGEIIEMDLTFVDTSFTLAVESGWNVSIIWE